MHSYDYFTSSLHWMYHKYSTFHTISVSVLQDDSVVHHMAAKAIENISTTVAGPSHPLVTTEIGSALWYLFTHSTVEAVRVTAISVSSHAYTHMYV